MKNIIAITSLLVAGTALANAATTWTYVGGDNGSWTEVSNWQIDGVAATTAPAGATGTSGDTRNVVVIGDGKTVTGTITDFSICSLIVNVGENSILTLSKRDLKIVNSTFNIDGILKFGSNMWLDMPNNDSKVGNHTRNTPIFNLGSTGSVVYSGSINSPTTASLSVTGTFDSTAETLGIQTRTLFSYDGTSTGSNYVFTGLLDSQNASFSFNGSVASTAIAEENLTLGDIGKYWLSYSADAKSIVLNYVVGTIPEPSAFGLLAGAGALALVAARRRRTKKA